MLIVPDAYDVRLYGRTPVFPPSPPLDDAGVRHSLREARGWIEETFAGSDFEECLSFDYDGDVMIVDFRTAGDSYSLFAHAPSLDRPKGSLNCLGADWDVDTYLTRKGWQEILAAIVAQELKPLRDAED